VFAAAVSVSWIVEFRFLGLLEVVENDRPVSIGRGKESALLALLLVNVNRPLSIDRVIDELWDGRGPPENAAKTVQIYVSRLRGRLGVGRILTTPAGYMLQADPTELDASRFERLAAEGQSQLESGHSHRAEVLLTEALDVWRGDALADFRFDGFAQAEIGRLQERRGVAVADRIDARLGLSQGEELVSEVEALIREQPLWERPRRQLMLALYQAGRQADALDAYQAARSTLLAELGIEPSRGLRELHQQILNQDPALEVERPSGEPDKEGFRPPAGTSPHAPPAGMRDARKVVTALFVGIAITSDQGKRLDPETFRGIAGRALDEGQAAAERHGGSLESASGDALTAVFGLPTVHEDDALRAVKAASEVRRALAGLTDELAAERAVRLDCRIGISTGEVITGGNSPTQGRATGEPLSQASHLAMPGKIVIDDATHRLLRDAIVARFVDDAWHVVDVADGSAGQPSRLTSPMVGRERERRRLRDAFEQAVGDRSCQLFTVLGLAGVGKSRLVQDLLRDLDGRALVARGRCLPYGEGITYWPLAEAVNEVVGLDGSESTDQVLERLTRAFGEGQDCELAALRVADTIGLVEVAGGIVERFEAVGELFASLARTRPLVIVFDDVHWGEATFLDLIEHLADWMRDVPILLVCLARPELLDLRPGWAGGKLNATTALLEPLSDDECAALIRNLVGQAGLSEEVEARIAGAAEGNPLFVEEMLSMLIDDGRLVRENGRWTANGDFSEVRVPPTIQALLAARLDQLGEDERAVIERAAVGGKVFYEGAVADLAPPDLEPTVSDVLASLTRKDLIRPERSSLGEQTYHFRHLLIRDAAYESIPKEARAALHERFGRWLDHAAGGRAIEHEEVVGYHLEQAYWYRAELGPADAGARAIAREAAERLGSAGRRAFVRSDAPAGVNLISRAVALLPPDDPLRVELVPNVRVVQGLATDLTWADRVLTEAVEAAATTGDRALAAHALVQRGLLRLFTEPGVTAGELIDVAERSIAVFAELRDELGLARAWRLKAQAHYLARHAGACAEASELALEHARLAGDDFEEQEIVEWLVIALLLGPAPAADAAERCRRLVEDLSEMPLLQAEVLAALAPLEAMLGRVDQAAELIGRSHETASKLNSWIWIGSFWHAFISLWQGDPIAAEQELRPAYDALKQMDEKSHFSSIAHALSHALYDQGRYAEAEQLTYECEEVSRANDVHSQISWRSIRSKTLAQRGEHQAAERLAREAVAFAEESDFLVAHADAITDLADVLELQDRRDEAIDALQEALELHERKGNGLAAIRVRARIDQLAG